MSRRLITSGSPFEKIAGYSRAVVEGDMCFVAGTTGSDPVTKAMPGDVSEQTRNVVRATYYVTDAKDFDAVFAVCGETFGEIRPAAAIVAVSALYKPEMKVEIEVTAKKRSA
ncbi:MAG: RidA family protein [Afipia sp.]|nr:RidA family protein [Afipia sp.]